MADETFDLIYLDPPFNSNATYNVLFRERSGEESATQITAFEDTWHWIWELEDAYRDMVTRARQGRQPAGCVKRLPPHSVTTLILLYDDDHCLRSTTLRSQILLGVG